MNRTLRILAVILIVIGLAVVSWPFLPNIRYYLFPQRISARAEEIIRLPPVSLPRSPTTSTASSALPTAVTPTPTPFPDPMTPTSSPVLPTTEPMIIIPKIGLEARIVPDLDPASLMEGVGHDPSTQAPGETGVCILYGHRFLNYIDPSSGYFYLLDKLAPGDQVVIIWEGSIYHFTVKDSFTIEPDDFSIYEQKDKPTLILVTCTPLWSDRYRLVVIAEPS
jgi:LPXTG-site transpeptidase (sortase) family protein